MLEISREKLDSNRELPCPQGVRSVQERPGSRSEALLLLRAVLPRGLEEATAQGASGGISAQRGVGGSRLVRTHCSGPGDSGEHWKGGDLGRKL